MKKEAMFGLDARIALAIFGALSVISGAALYSAIQNSKITAILTEVNEIEKAIIQYYLDTGALIPHSTSNNTRDLSAIALKKDPVGVSNWNGPYFPYTNDTLESFTSSLGFNITIPYRVTGTWADMTASTCKRSSASCHVYIWMSNSDSAITRALEERIDGNVTTSAENFAGDFRYTATGMMFKLDLYYDPALSPTP